MADRGNFEFGLFAPHRQLLETQEFTQELADIGPIKRMDEALAALQEILTNDAEVYPVLRGFEKTRLAKTRAVYGVPALNVWFEVDEDSVTLLYVEVAPTE